MGDHSAPEPTQTVYPGKAVARTAIQILIGLAAVMPFLVADMGVDKAGTLVAGALAISAVVTRVMSIPAVNAALTMYLRLGAEPKH